jgi:TPR repeat protein
MGKYLLLAKTTDGKDKLSQYFSIDADDIFLSIDLESIRIKRINAERNLKDVKKADLLWAKGDFKNSFQIYNKQVNLANAHVFAILSWCYLTGSGTLIDIASASNYAQKAIEKEELMGYGCLAVIKEINKENEDAKVLFKKVLNNADYFEKSSFGNYIIGKAYDFNENCSEAFKYFQRSAFMGNAFGQHALGHCYYYGNGTNKNEKESVNWFRKSAEQGYALAQNFMGIIYNKGGLVKKDDYEAVKLFRKAAEQGEFHGQNNLGVMYQFGYGITKDEMEAVKWYKKAAEQGYALAQSNLGVMYQFGYGITKDEKEAVKWYKKAAEQGDFDGQNNLGVMYEFGYGITKDVKEAVKWYKKAADQGHEGAIDNLKRNGYTR